MSAPRLRLGQAAEARADHERAPRLARDANTGHAEAGRVGFRIVVAQALTVLLDVHLTSGDLPQALACGDRAPPCCSITPSKPPPVRCSGRRLEFGLGR
ncbi:hypothetical protein ACIRG5_14970 [Lentzea sp. NPDC102401]|uniref:hypothetical protein n=1 Tax=Lentzea sp. NPDC102401 TaxID=3364128 RepID=UPI0037F388BE